MFKIKTVFAFLALMFLFLAFPFCSQAMLAPSVHVVSLNIDNTQPVQAGSNISGKFTVSNSEQYAMSDIKYVISAFERDNKTGEETMFDEVMSLDTISMSSQEKKEIKFSYLVPNSLPTKNYGFRIELQNSSGLSLGWQDIALNVVNNNPNNVFLNINNPKVIQNDKEYYPLEGVFFKADEEPVISFEASSASSVTATVTPSFTIYDRSTNGKIVNQFTKDQITLKPKENKKLQYSMPQIQTPGSYLAEVKFTNGDQTVSNVLYFRWVVEGQSARIINVSLDKFPISAGQTANLSVVYVGSADTKTLIGQGVISAEIYNEKGELVGQKDVPVNLDNSGTAKISVPVKKDVQEPGIKVKIEKDGKVFDQYDSTFKLPLEQQPLPKSSSAKTLQICIAVLILILLAAIVFFAVKMKNKKVILPVLIFIAFLGGACLVNITSIWADGGGSTQEAVVQPAPPQASEVYYYGCSREGGNCMTLSLGWNEPVPGSVYEYEDDLAFSGTISTGECLNLYRNSTLQFYLLNGPLSSPEDCPPSICISDLEDQISRNSIGGIGLIGAQALNNGRYSLAWKIPEGIREGQYYAVVVATASSNQVNVITAKDYFQAPISIKTNLAKPKGSFDSATCYNFLGWDCAPSDYSQPLQVDFYKNGPIGTGTLIGSTIAKNAGTQTVKDNCGGDINHEFSFPTPNNLKDGGTYSIYAYGVNTSSGDKSLLSLSPRTISNCTTPLPAVNSFSLTDPDWCSTPFQYNLHWNLTSVQPATGKIVSIAQSAKQIQVSTDSGFSSITYDSGKVTDSNTAYALTATGSGLEYNKTYYLRVKVWDTNDIASAWSNIKTFITPKHEYPQPDFTQSPAKPKIGDTIQFTDNSTFYDNSTKHYWSWTFQDGNPSLSTLQNPSVVFNSSGNKEITLTVTDSDGYICSASNTASGGGGGTGTGGQYKWIEIAPK